MTIQTTDNTDRVLTKRIGYPRSILALTYTADDVERLRHLASHITLKQGKHPTMSLLARFGLALVAQMHAQDAEGLAAKLNRMTTDDPKPAKVSKRKAVQQ